MQGKYAHLFRQLNYVAQLWENPIVGMALIDQDGNFAEINSAYCSILGKRREEILGTHWSVYTATEDIAECAYLLDGVQKGKLHDYQLKQRYRVRDNHFVEVVIGVKAISSDEAFVCIYTTCIPIEVLIDKADLIVQYRPGPVAQKATDVWDQRINNIYRVIGITLGVGALASGVLTGLYYFFKVIDILVEQIGGK